MYGYAGKILHVNVNTGENKTETLSEDFAKQYIGGTGFGIKTLLDNQKPGIDPFDPENPLIYALGPLAGTMVPSTASKFGVFAKSPASNLLGEAYSTGYFGAEMRRAGYDILVIKGKAEKPVYLWIDDNSIQLMDASHLWGRSPWETENTIREDLGDYYIRVSAIGAAGENLVRVACIINDRNRAAGRTGLGAIMGSKNLKAVAIRGSRDVKVADLEALKEHCVELYERAKGPATKKYRTLGTPANVLTLNAAAAMPTRNYQSATFEGAETVSGEYLNEHFITKIQACSACPMRCEHVAVIPEGPWKGTAARVEYEPTMAFGPYCGVDRLEGVIKAMEQCDIYGVDAIGTGIIIGFAMECFEKGLINEKDTGGLNLKFGNKEAMVEMIKKIGLRENVGDILAEGVKRAAEKIGGGSEEFAMHIKGVEMTGYDVRGLKTCALGFAVSRRGADHQRHGSYGHDLSGKVDRFKVEKGRGKLVMNDEDNYCIFDSMILCKFNRGIWRGYDEIAQIYREVTGIPMTGEELHQAGERISNIGRIYNIR
ncbi:MAG: aldehyde ferredoxin oxidoreductase family protein, partial [Promethearchaeota archaeon]